jgi:glycosyltransferase involved in cell wall biosynthesis/SAM-dependent methyltransferase
MRIAIFAHSSNLGGAEYSLRYLVDLLRYRHEIEIFFPVITGSEPEYFRNSGITCHSLQAPRATPHFSSALLSYSKFDFGKIIPALAARNYDVAISNTSVILHGGLICRQLGIPHITWAHEDLSEKELRPSSIPPSEYISILEDLSDSLLACSHHTSRQYSNRLPRLVFEPYDYRIPESERLYSSDGDYVIQLIGVQMIRKNMHFAATAAKNLLLYGLKVRLDIIGSNNNGSNKIARILKKRGIPHRLIGFAPNPYEINQASKVVTMVSSLSEPYGLTIPESLSRGIPVIASDSGGPRELLSEECIYAVDNLDECTRKLILAFENYDDYVGASILRYQQLRSRKSPNDLIADLEKLLLDASAQVKLAGEQKIEIDTYIDRISKALSLNLTDEDILASIKSVSQIHEPNIDANIDALYEKEKNHPGTAVYNDISRFDVIPFTYSANMETLYKRGTGLALEILSTMHQPARIDMLCFTICGLHYLSKTLGRMPRLLAVGDGIGIDSIRLACCGFHVDYIDFSGSLMSKIAQENIAKANSFTFNQLALKHIDQPSGSYDAIVCFEVIEHVPSPPEFADFLAKYCKNEGYLFISECFNGIQDQWPTHLLSNEKYAGMLPFILCNHFRYTGMNEAFFGKPYVFKKMADVKPSDILKVLEDRRLALNYVRNQLDIGI